SKNAIKGNVLLERMNKTGCAFFLSSQDLLKYSLAELLSELAQSENDALASDELSRAAEQDEVRLELERSANGNPAMAPRERKAGCKNFFWKTFTSC
ncbi:SMS protein, partial [Polyodon spathula]|nr:SMS protein [Polyodon spathula]